MAPVAFALAWLWLHLWRGPSGETDFAPNARLSVLYFRIEAENFYNG